MRPTPAERIPDELAPQAAAALAEPATQWALWPTFLRRTLADDLLHAAANHARLAARRTEVPPAAER